MKKACVSVESKERQRRKSLKLKRYQFRTKFRAAWNGTPKRTRVDII